MSEKRHFSLKFVFLVPALLSLIVLALTVKNYYDAVNRDIDDEYARIARSLERSTKILTALDYSFSNYHKAGSDMMLEHNSRVNNDLCQMWPIDALLLSDGAHLDLPQVDLSYMVVGNANLCTPASALYQRVTQQISLAPILSFLHDVDSFIYGIHYVDTEGYIISSPDTLARNISLELLNTIKARPYWQQTAQHRDKITMTGPGRALIVDKMIVSLSMSVYRDSLLQGMISLDLVLPKLIGNEGKLANEIRLIDLNTESIPKNSVRFEPITIDGVMSSHALLYQLDWENEIGNFFVFERYSLVVAGFIYVLSVIVLAYVNGHAERVYLKDLAAKDPMTGLLNRRGMEEFLSNTIHKDNVMLAVFDIDNFKSINDTYGHDVGDNVICYMADQIECNIRDCDAAARFGGEEFVIYLTCSNVQKMHRIIERIKNEICQHSYKVVEGGFTVSGGVDVVKNGNCDFEGMFKAADNKLYQAKETGKDKLVF
ncbi:GGDEF domain-containing protein [Vibrio sp. NTOU-M3]|uniref:GGDEF domain-containing protein n=1 Tax=Vibrio sp. NTOU-M3 TaxID=3234954 RepID=UPI00349FC5E0